MTERDGKGQVGKLSSLLFNKKKNRLDLFCLLCLFAFSLFTSRALFLSDKSFIAGTDALSVHLLSEDYLWKIFSNGVYGWSTLDGCGRAVSPLAPPFLLAGAVAIAINSLIKGLVTIFTKFIFFIPLPLAGFSMYFLTYHFLKKRVGALVSALFYMYNQWFMSELISDVHLFISLGYALAPLVFLSLENALRAPSVRNILALSITLTLMLSLGSQIPYILLLFSTLYIVFWILLPNHSQETRKKTVAKVASAFIICLLLNAYWFLPEFLFGRYSTTLSGVYYTIDDAYVFSQKTLTDAMAIRTSYQSRGGQRIPYWELMSLQPVYANGLMFIIPALALSAILISRDRRIIFYTLTAAVSSFLSLGPYGLPFEAFIWLWTNIPVYSTFRVGGRFLMMTSLSYAYLLGVTSAWIYSKLSSTGTVISNNVILKLTSLRKRMVNKIFLASIILIIITYTWEGSVVGFQVYNWPDEYIEPFKWISDQSGDFRVLTAPYGRLYVDYPWSSHGTDIGIVSYGIHNRGLFISGTGYTDDYTWFLSSLIHSNTSNRVSSLLGIAGVRFIVLEPDTSANEKKFFMSDEELAATSFCGNSPVLENTMWSPHLFSAENSSLIFGGLNTLPSLLNVDDFELNNWALFFKHRAPSPSLEESDIIILSEANFLDLLFMTSGKPYTTMAAEYAFPSLNASKYWMSSSQWWELGKLALGRNTLSTSGNTSINIPIKASEDGQYEIFLRIAHGPNRGALSARIDGETLLSNFQPQTLHPIGFGWIKLRTVYLTKGEHTLTLANDGSGSNDIDIVALIPTTKFQSLSEEVKMDFQNTSARIVIIMEAEDAFSRDILSIWQPSHSWEGRASNGYTLSSKMVAESSSQFYVPRSGSYMIVARTVDGSAYGSLILDVDGAERFSIACNSTILGFKWHEVGPVTLSQGDHILKLINDGHGDVDIDELILYSLKEGEEKPFLKGIFSSQSMTNVTYTQHSPVEYVAHIETNRPFWLIFSESYHPLWEAYVDGKEVSSEVAYSFLNGFYINKVGKFDVKIYFKGQNYIIFGGVLSAISWITVLLYLAYPKIKGLKMAYMPSYKNRKEV